MTSELLFDGEHLRLLHVKSSHRNLMVTFDFRMTGKDGYGPANPGAGFARNGFDQLMIKTRRNDWFINPDTMRVEQMLASLPRQYDSIHALGYSMGGYGALRFASALHCNWITAVSPQTTIAPDQPPFDTRYHEEAQSFETALGRLPTYNAMQGAIIYDPFVRIDRAHAALAIAAFPNLHSVALPFGGHPATQALRESGRAGVIQRAAMQLVPPARIAHSHRVARRTSPAYWTALAKRAGPHHSDLAATARGNAGQTAQKPAR